MKNFLIGLVIGILLGGTGVYTSVKEKTQKVATKKNAEKVVKAAEEFGKAVQGVFDE